VSYESEERYWTDYLRVALPVIGLLLMLALFWWWAQQFIGDDKDGNQVALEATQTTEIATKAAPTPTNTLEVVVEPTQVATTPTSGTDGNAGNRHTTRQRPVAVRPHETERVFRKLGYCGCQNSAIVCPAVRHRRLLPLRRRDHERGLSFGVGDADLVERRDCAD